MELEKKLELLAEALEVETEAIQAGTALSELDEWDSMAKLALIVMMRDEFDKKLSAEQIREFKTVQDILDFMD